MRSAPPSYIRTWSPRPSWRRTLRRWLHTSPHVEVLLDVWLLLVLFLAVIAVASVCQVAQV